MFRRQQVLVLLMKKCPKCASYYFDYHGTMLNCENCKPKEITEGGINENQDNPNQK